MPKRSLRVLVAGATGAIGAPLVAGLAARGHHVIAVSRQATAPRQQGVDPIACDVLDASAIGRVVAKAAPDAIVSELTNLPKDLNPRTMSEDYARSNRVRLEGTRNVLAAARASRTPRVVVQSAAFWYAPTPGMVKTEKDPLWLDAPEPIGEAVRTLRQMEDEVTALSSAKTLLLRYGTFYGLGTWFHRDGTMGKLILARRQPIIGKGEGTFSFLHIDDAVEATIAATESPATGVLNVVDNEPLAAKQWVPIFARALGAPPPRKAPAWLARWLAGKALVEYTTRSRGASNAAAKAALGWRPRYPSLESGLAADGG